MVKTNGIFTIEEFKPPMDGRIVKVVCPGGYLHNKIYTCIDGDYVGPYDKPEGIETGIGIRDFLRRGLHSAYIFVINDLETRLNNIIYQPNPREILISGKTVSIKLEGRLNVSIRVRDSDFLLKDYDEIGFKSAEDRALDILNILFKKEIDDYLDYVNAKSLCDFYSLSDQLDTVAQQIQLDIEQRITDVEVIKHPWIDLISCKCELRIANRDEIIDAINYEWEKNEDRDNKTFETNEKVRYKKAKVEIELRKTIGNALVQKMIDGALSISMKDILTQYISYNPDMPPEEILKLMEGLISMNIKHSRDALSELKEIKENIP